MLDALATALQLDEAERAHLLDLARTASTSSSAARRRRRPTQQHVRPSVQRILDGMTGIPAFVRNARLDILAINPLGRVLYSEAYADPTRPVHLVRFAFLDPRAATLHPNWEDSANTSVALLRTEAGRNPRAARSPAERHRDRGLMSRADPKGTTVTATQEPSGAEKAIGDFAPKLVSLTDDVLFGDVWERAELSKRDRSLVTVAALVAGGNTEQLSFHLGFAKENGLTETELKEAIIHLAFYTGWPRAMSAIGVAKQVFGG